MSAIHLSSCETVSPGYGDHERVCFSLQIFCKALGSAHFCVLKNRFEEKEEWNPDTFWLLAVAFARSNCSLFTWLFSVWMHCCGPASNQSNLRRKDFPGCPVGGYSPPRSCSHCIHSQREMYCRVSVSTRAASFGPGIQCLKRCCPQLTLGLPC